ncbi:hypothetical protein OIU76_013222 [Salix suchowensis]|uniref:Uncharacterized protein n=1 Tax=Salix koriyanagi TaxID=2511006 RepID=A0A9Q1AEA1_9ROSI|nr:hypothetical protein OIU76_013222 [Salix suchowensis]KAJ6767997.1 hypothetical protein OIU74_021793 [Salix koriyanagi]
MVQSFFNSYQGKILKIVSIIFSNIVKTLVISTYNPHLCHKQNFKYPKTSQRN